MKLWPTIRKTLATLVAVGLILAPLARPADAMMAVAAADTTHAASVPAAMDDQGATAGETAMDMAAGMPCCPHKMPNSDCGKNCPWMAACMAKCFTGLPIGARLPIASWLAKVMPPSNDALSESLAQAPPPRPPKA